MTELIWEKLGSNAARIEVLETRTNRLETVVNEKLQQIGDDVSEIKEALAGRNGIVTGVSKAVACGVGVLMLLAALWSAFSNSIFGG